MNGLPWLTNPSKFWNSINTRKWTSEPRKQHKLNKKVYILFIQKLIKRGHMSKHIKQTMLAITFLLRWYCW